MKDLIVRGISGLIGVILLILIVSKGGMLLKIGLLIVSILGVYELKKALKNIEINSIGIINYLFCVGIFLNSLEFKYMSLSFILFLFLIMLFIMLVVKKDVKIEDIFATIFINLYVPFFMFHIALLDNNQYIWLVFITAWGTDTFAYIFGNLFGKNKLCPKLSPNKTIEGSIGGIIGSVVVSFIYVKYFNLNYIYQVIVLAFICSIMAQFGDLAASRIKRMCKIKDYGYIMPGHGGIMDRFDSILFTAPIVYYYIEYVLI